MEHYIVFSYVSGNIFFLTQEHRLGHIAYVAYVPSLAQLLADAQYGLLSHAVDNDVATRIAEDALAHAVLPVVVMGEPAHARLYASEHHGHIGEETFEYLRIDNGGILRAHVVSAVGTIGILGAQTAGSSVLVHHGVHAAGGYAEEETRPAELLEIAEVAMPVGLGHDSHLIASSLQRSAYHRHTKRGVVYIGVAGEEYHIELVPTAQFHLFLRCGKEVGEAGRLVGKRSGLFVGHQSFTSPSSLTGSASGCSPSHSL